MKVDATTMEGFMMKQLDELLDLHEMGLKSAVLLPLGYYHEAIDWLVKMKKVRTSMTEFIIEIK